MFFFNVTVDFIGPVVNKWKLKRCLKVFSRVTVTYENAFTWVENGQKTVPFIRVFRRLMFKYHLKIYLHDYQS